MFLAWLGMMRQMDLMRADNDHLYTLPISSFPSCSATADSQPADAVITPRSPERKRRSSQRAASGCNVAVLPSCRRRRAPDLYTNFGARTSGSGQLSASNTRSRGPSMPAVGFRNTFCMPAQPCPRLNPNPGRRRSQFDDAQPTASEEPSQARADTTMPRHCRSPRHHLVSAASGF